MVELSETRFAGLVRKEAAYQGLVEFLRDRKYMGIKSEELLVICKVLGIEDGDLLDGA